MDNQLLPEHTFGYTHDNSTVIWDVKDIWKVADKLPVIKLSVDLFTLAAEYVQQEYDDSDWTRVDEANLQYPVLVGKCQKADYDYLVIDGFHRIAKHIRKGHRTIPCKIIKKMPPPLWVKGKPFEIDGLNFDWVSKHSPSQESWMNW